MFGIDCATSEDVPDSERQVLNMNQNRRRPLRGDTRSIRPRPAHGRSTD